MKKPSHNRQQLLKYTIVRAQDGVISEVLSAGTVGKDGPDHRLRDGEVILLVSSVSSCDQIEREFMRCTLLFSRRQW